MTDAPDRKQRVDTSLCGVAARCLSIDIEVGVNDRRIDRFAAVRGDSGQGFVLRGKAQVGEALARLDTFAQGAELLLGHNIVAFDAPFLGAANAGLQLLKLPMLDTLRLNPLAFPRDPHHHLVKHYQEGALKRASRSDPDLDARLTLTLLEDQTEAMRSTGATQPDLPAAWHWLTCVDDADAAVDAFFTHVREQSCPSDVEGRAAVSRCLAGHGCDAQGTAILSQPRRSGWAVAYALAWLSVAGARNAPRCSTGFASVMSAS